MDVFDEMFDAFQHSAFRLEALPEYRVGGDEQREVEDYLSGCFVPFGANKGWAEAVRDWTDKQKQVFRIRIVPPRINPYIRYEMDWCYPGNAAAGEDIRFASSDQLDRIRGALPRTDYWLFDNKHLLYLRYTEDGCYLGESLEPSEAVVKQYVLLSAGLEAVAIRMTDFYMRVRSQTTQRPAID